MVIALDPELIRLGPLALAWHGIFVALGLIAGRRLAAQLGPLVGLDSEVVWAGSWSILGGGLIGARLLFVLENLDAYADAPLRVLAVYEGGISVFGAVLGGVAGAALYAWRASVSLAPLLDAAATGFLLGQAIGRIGDLINGEHRGLPTDVPWAVTYIHPNTLADPGVAVHPAVGYELLWDVGAAGAAVWLLRRGAPAGVAFWLGLGLYGLGRFWVGFFRLDARYAMGLGLAQWIGLLIVPVAAVALARLLTRPASWVGRGRAGRREAAAPGHGTKIRSGSAVSRGEQ